VIALVIPGRSLRLSKWRSLPLLANYALMLVLFGLTAS